MPLVVTYISRQVFPHAPSPTMTSLRRISAILETDKQHVSTPWTICEWMCLNDVGSSLISFGDVLEQVDVVVMTRGSVQGQVIFASLRVLYVPVGSPTVVSSKENRSTNALSLCNNHCPERKGRMRRWDGEEVMRVELTTWMFKVGG
jgi:hypothetical protein